MATVALGLLVASLLACGGALGRASCDDGVPGALPPTHLRCAGACGQLAAVSTLYRRTSTWSDYAQPLAVLQLGQAASALHFVLGAREAAPPRFLAVGDATGGLHLLSPTGSLVLQHHTGTPAAVTAVGSFRLSRNATVLLTGHSGGELRLHLLLQQRQPAAAVDVAAGSAAAAGQHPPGIGFLEEGEAGDSSGGAGGGGEGTLLSLSLLEAFAPEAVLCSTPPTAAAPAAPAATAACSEQQQQHGTCATGQAHGCAPITGVHAAAGRGSKVAATAVVVDALGRLAVLKHGGPANQGARLVRRVALEQLPLAVRLPGATATVLSGGGVVNQRLSQPTAPRAGGAAGQPPRAAGGAAAAATGSEPPLVFKACRGLNGSSIVAAAFDAQHSSRAYAVTNDGRVLSLVVGGERGSQTSCTVKAAAALPAGLLLPAAASPCYGGNAAASQHEQQQQPAVAVAVVPGYLLVTAGDVLAVFNATSAPRGPPRLLLLQQLAPLREPFGVPLFPAAGQEQQQGQQQQDAGEAGATVAAGAAQQLPPPLLAASKQGHVALMLNSTVLALYETAFPYREGPQANKPSTAWLQLFQPLAMVLVAAAVIYRARARRGKGGGGGAFAGDARLREFERLLQDPMAGAAGSRRNRPPPPPTAWPGHAGGSSGSDAEDTSLLGGIFSAGAGGAGGGSRLAGGAPKRRGAPGRANGSGASGALDGGRGGGGGGGGGDSSSRDRAARSRRAAALAAADDRDTTAMSAQYRAAAAAAAAGGGGGMLARHARGDSSGGEGESEGEDGSGAGAGGRLADGMPVDGFGSDIDLAAHLPGGSGGRASDDLSQLRHRFGQARISE